MRFKHYYMLSESKQVIVGMGYPEVISKVLFEKFGKLAPLIAKWYKQYRASGQYAEDPDWFRQVHWNPRESPSLWELVYMYDSTKDAPSYLAAAEKMGLEVEPYEVEEEGFLTWERIQLYKQIVEKLFEYHFWRSYNIIKDITSGALKDVAPYRSLPFLEAEYKYERRNMFRETQPIKVYENGFKWIDIGKKCNLIGRQMSNCGSVGLMSHDDDATILCLFGPNNKPHVMVTYSPNERRISGDQSAGYTEVKEKYHNYVLDLAQTLGVAFDADKSKSMTLAVKYRLRGFEGLEPMPELNTLFNQYWRFQMGGQPHYTNGHTVISDAEVRRAQAMIQAQQVSIRAPQPNVVQTVLTRANMDDLHNAGIKYTPIQQMQQGVA